MNFINTITPAEPNNTGTNQVSSQVINDLLYLANRFDQFKIAFELS